MNPALEFLPQGLGICLALILSRAAARTRSSGAGVLMGATVGALATGLSTLALSHATGLGPGPRDPRDLLFPLAFLVHLLALVALLRRCRVPLPELLAPLVHLPAFLLRLLLDAGALVPPGPGVSALSWLLPPAGFMVDLPDLAGGSLPSTAWKGALAYGAQVAVFLGIAGHSGSFPLSLSLSVSLPGSLGRRRQRQPDGVALPSEDEGPEGGEASK